MDWLASQLPELAALGDRLRHLWIQLDFAYTMLRGAIADGVLENGFDGIDGETFVSWLRRHGASQLTLDSALLRGLHDFVFAQENGDPSRPNLAAGVALRLILRMTFTYKGAVMWKMQAGMGDVVFAPLYQVLQARGVQFEFFHRVNALTLAEDGQSIAQIRLGRQATLRNGTYAPLIEVGGLPCWPNQPRYDQLIEGDQLQTRHVNLESIWTDWPDVNEVTLASGREFDIVVLGISLAALRDTCSELLRANPSWRDMLDRVATVQTQAAQLWFTPTLSQTGWPLPSPILTGYSGPLETWADMSQTLAQRRLAERRPAGKRGLFLCHASGCRSFAATRSQSVSASAGESRPRCHDCRAAFAGSASLPRGVRSRQRRVAVGPTARRVRRQRRRAVRGPILASQRRTHRAVCAVAGRDDARPFESRPIRLSQLVPCR